MGMQEEFPLFDSVQWPAPVLGLQTQLQLAELAVDAKATYPKARVGVKPLKAVES